MRHRELGRCGPLETRWALSLFSRSETPRLILSVHEKSRHDLLHEDADYASGR